MKRTEIAFKIVGYLVSIGEIKDPGKINEESARQIIRDDYRKRIRGQRKWVSLVELSGIIGIPEKDFILFYREII